jgi:hypothetical protein
MAVSLVSTGVMFPDGTTQTTAAVSSAPTTEQVLSATAGASVGAVGTYAFLSRPVNVGSGGTVAAGGTAAGSTLRYTSTNSYRGRGTGTPSGTWRCMGHADLGSYTYYGPQYYNFPTVWLRIS